MVHPTNRVASRLVGSKELSARVRPYRRWRWALCRSSRAIDVAICACWIGVLLACGCAHRQPLPIPTTAQVKAVKVQPTGSKKAQLPRRKAQAALGTRPTPWWAQSIGFRRFWVPLDRDMVIQDMPRLERFYEAHGFFDARCVSRSTRYKGKEMDDGRRWAIVEFTVAEGPRSVVRDVNIHGTDSLPPDLLERLSRLPELAAGQPFSILDQDDDRLALQDQLQRSGYAYASVRRRADAYPEEEVVDLSYTVDEGIPTTFGEVVIQGLTTVPEKRVWREIRIRPGHVYSTGKLRRLQDDLFGMGVFSMVTVTPDLSDPTEDEVDVQVALRESRPISIKVGGGLGMERGRDDAHVSFAFSHNNLFGRLIQLSIRNKFGWAVVPDILHAASNGPLLEGETELSQPGVPFRTTTLRQKVGFELGVESGYKFLSPEVAAGLDWRIHRLLSAGIGYNLEFYWLYWQDPELFNTLEDVDLPEIDMDGTYALSSLEQHVVFDARNDPLITTRGLFARVSVEEAGGVLGGGFDYVKLSGEVRGFIDPWPKRLVLAARLSAGWVWTRNETTSAPLSQRFKAGGSASVRGWGRDQLGPRIYPCDEDCSTGSARECHPIATGGHMMLIGGPEVRVFPVDIGKMPLGFAVFLDAGRVWDKPEDFGWDGLMFSSGGGVRLQSPVGVVRLDVAVRLNDDPDFSFSCDPRVLVHFGLSEAF